MCQCQCSLSLPFVGDWCIPLEYGNEILNNLSYAFVNTEIASENNMESLASNVAILGCLFLGAIITSKGQMAQKGIKTTKASF